MSDSRRSRVAVLIMTMLGLVSGCTLGPEASPQPIPTATRTAGPATMAPSQVTQQVTVYLLADSHLVPVQREIPIGGGIDAVLVALGNGPTAEETASGLGTALPTATVALRATIADGVADITVPEKLTQLGIVSQVYAVGQLVYSVTEIDGVSRVQLTNGKQDIETPVSGGALVNRPVDRSDYGSIAP